MAEMQLQKALIPTIGGTFNSSLCVVGEKVKLCWNPEQVDQYPRCPSTLMSPLRPVHTVKIIQWPGSWMLITLLLHLHRCRQLIHDCWYGRRPLYYLIWMDRIGNLYEHICPHKCESFLSFNAVHPATQACCYWRRDRRQRHSLMIHSQSANHNRLPGLVRQFPN